MSAMHARLGAAIEDDLLRFSGEDFADARLGSVLGSVKRRRAARAAGVSSVSLFGAGAIAVGASNVPWGSFASGTSPAGSPSVVCSTATPDAVVEAAGADPVIVTTFEGTPTSAESETSPDGVTKAHDADPGQASWSVAFPGDGGELAKVERVGGGLVVALGDGSMQTLQPGADGTYSVTLPSGDRYVVTLDPSMQDLEVTVMTAEDEGVTASTDPAVTCVTTTPEPSESASPVPTASPSSDTSASPAATPDPSASPSAGAGPSPFQCGAELGDTAQGTDELAIGDIRWVSAQQAEDEILAYYEGSEESLQLDLSGDNVPVARLLFGPGALSDGPQSWSLREPEDYGSVNGPGADVDTWAAVGAQYALVSGGQVIAHGGRFDADAQGEWISPDDAVAENVGSEVYLLNAAERLSPCEGVTDAQLADSQLVVVAGMKQKIDGVETGPFYAWTTVPPQP